MLLLEADWDENESGRKSLEEKSRMIKKLRKERLIEFRIQIYLNWDFDLSMEEINNGPLFLASKSEREYCQLHIKKGKRRGWRKEIIFFSDEELFRYE